MSSSQENTHQVLSTDTKQNDLKTSKLVLLGPPAGDELPLGLPLLPDALPLLALGHAVRGLPEQAVGAALLRLLDEAAVDLEGDVALVGVAVRAGEEVDPGDDRVV